MVCSGDSPRIRFEVCPKPQVGIALRAEPYVQTAVALHDQINGLDERFSILLKDKDIQMLVVKRVIELGIE